MTRCDDELQGLIKELERHALSPLRTDWVSFQEGADPMPYGMVDLRYLVHVLNSWEQAGREWGDLMRDADRHLTRLEQERDTARAMLQPPPDGLS